LASLKEALRSEVDLQDLVTLIVNISIEASCIPEKTVGVEVKIKRSGMSVLTMSFFKFVLIPVGSPMKSRSEGIDSTSWIVDIIAT